MHASTAVQRYGYEVQRQDKGAGIHDNGDIHPVPGAEKRGRLFRFRPGTIPVFLFVDVHGIRYNRKYGDIIPISPA
jgi:hypothetical protein